jgi:enoyl-CoA hydratase
MRSAGDRSLLPMTNQSSNAASGVTCSIVEGVATIAIDDGKANALSHAVLGGVEDALDEVERAEAGSLVVVGRQGKFSAGFDLSVMTSGPENARDLLGRGAELGLRLFEFPVPVVFGVTGHALAMGGILLCCADVRIGARGAFKLGLPEVRIGMPVPAFAVELCRDRLTPRWFTRSIQLAESLTPDQALDAGFLDELVEPGEVAARVHEVATELAGAVHDGPFRLTRRTVRSELTAKLRSALDADLASFSVEPG